MFSPAIPDNTYKVLLYIGIILISFSTYQDLEATQKYNDLVSVSNSYIDSINLKIMYSEHDKQVLFNLADHLSKKYSVANPIRDSNSVTYFIQTFKGTNEELLVSDTLQNIWQKYKYGAFEIDVLNKKSDFKKEELKNEDDNLTIERISYIIFAVFGFLLLAVGYLGMAQYQKLQQQLTEIEILQKSTKYKRCQSCGRNFSAVIKHGKELDGNENSAFCIDCYGASEFKEPNLTWSEFEQRIMPLISSKKKQSEKEKLLKSFQKLDRWNTDLYS